MSGQAAPSDLRRDQIDLGVLEARVQKEKSVKVKTVDNEGIETELVMKEISDNFEQIRADVRAYLLNTEMRRLKYEPKCIDFVMDRLNEEKYIICVKHIVRQVNMSMPVSSIDGKILQSLVVNQMVILKQDKIMFVYNAFKRTMLYVSDDSSELLLLTASKMATDWSKDEFNRFMEMKSEFSNYKRQELQGLLADGAFKVKSETAPNTLGL